MKEKEKSIDDRILIYEARLVEADADYAKKTKELNNIKNEMTNCNKTRSNLKKELENLYIQKKPLQVSDHAIVQYLRRIKNINIDSIILEMISGLDLEMVDYFKGNGRFKNKDNILFVIRDKTIVTIYEENKK